MDEREEKARRTRIRCEMCSTRIKKFPTRSRKRPSLETKEQQDDTYLHHAVPVPQQLPQIAILPARYPDLGGIPHPQLEIQFRQQSLDRASAPAHWLRIRTGMRSELLDCTLLRLVGEIQGSSDDQHTAHESHHP